MDFKNFTNLNFNLILSIFLVLVIIGFSAYNNEEHFFKESNKISNSDNNSASSADKCAKCIDNKKQQWSNTNKKCSCA